MPPAPLPAGADTAIRSSKAPATSTALPMREWPIATRRSRGPRTAGSPGSPPRARCPTPTRPAAPSRSRDTPGRTACCGRPSSRRRRAGWCPRPRPGSDSRQRVAAPEQLRVRASPSAPDRPRRSMTHRRRLQHAGGAWAASAMRGAGSPERQRQRVEPLALLGKPQHRRQRGPAGRQAERREDHGGEGALRVRRDEQRDVEAERAIRAERRGARTLVRTPPPATRRAPRTAPVTLPGGGGIRPTA